MQINHNIRVALMFLEIVLTRTSDQNDLADDDVEMLWAAHSFIQGYDGLVPVSEEALALHAKIGAAAAIEDAMGTKNFMPHVQVIDGDAFKNPTIGQMAAALAMLRVLMDDVRTYCPDYVHGEPKAKHVKAAYQLLNEMAEFERRA